MAEPAIKQTMRRLINKSFHILENEAYFVSRTAGKMSEIADLICLDRASIRFFKICLETITKQELKNLLRFNEIPPGLPCVIEILVWRYYENRPFGRFKLFCNQPDQTLDPGLKKIIK